MFCLIFRKIRQLPSSYGTMGLPSTCSSMQYSQFSHHSILYNPGNWKVSLNKPRIHQLTRHWDADDKEVVPSISLASSIHKNVSLTNIHYHIIFLYLTLTPLLTENITQQFLQVNIIISASTWSASETQGTGLLRTTLWLQIYKEYQNKRNWPTTKH